MATIDEGSGSCYSSKSPATFQYSLAVKLYNSSNGSIYGSDWLLFTDHYRSVTTAQLMLLLKVKPSTRYRFSLFI